MRILVVNDDGYMSPGLTALAEVARNFGEVFVIAPDKDYSGVSSALTLDRPLQVREVGSKLFYLTGTPTDCVHIAMTAFFRNESVDLVLSGINDGANLGEDNLYSGTVAGALEGYIFGVSSIAFSLTKKGFKHLNTAVRVVRYVLECHIQSMSHASPYLLNVNIPAIPYPDLQGIQVTRLGRRAFAAPPLLLESPRGELMYWIGIAGEPKDSGPGTDFHAVQNNCVAITPLKLDRTALDKIAVFSDFFSKKPMPTL